ncbi:MAG: hypothetical protein GY869_20445, partial [Planctomycetes bacterium]|nr:hypothetical protein [Planctomycetota bacterium]
EPANPSITPEHIKPEWYFFFNFRVLKLTSLQLSVYITGFLGGVLFFWPFIEGWLRKRGVSERVPLILGLIGFLAFLGFTIWEALGH